MNRPRRPGARRWLALGVASLALLLGGCVYLRLLELKRQLADFDRHFTLQTTDGVRLSCLHPVLLSADLRWLGFEPATIRKIGTAEQWHLRWVKQLPPDVTETRTFEISFDLIFTQDKLSVFAVSESYFAFMPKSVVTTTIKSLGGARVDQKKRTVETDVPLSLRDDPAFTWPTRASVVAMLGLPTEELTDQERRVLRYRCVSADPAHKGKEFDLKLVFDAASEKLLRTTGRMPVGNIDLKFTPPAS